MGKIRVQSATLPYFCRIEWVYSGMIQATLGKVWGDLGYKDSDQASVQHSIQQKYDSVALWTLIFPIPLTI